MKLSVIRHAIAEDFHDFINSGGNNDEERPLTQKGIQRMEKNAFGICSVCPDIDLIATSPLVRAQATAEILRSQFPEANLEVWSELKPEYEPKDIIKKLQERTQYSHIALVGHEPNLTEFVNFSLTPIGERISHMKKGGLCVLSFELAPRKGSAQLQCWIQPSGLRSIAKSLKNRRDGEK